MKNKLFKYIIICLCLFFCYFLLANNDLINENIIYAINLWITKVFPSLFPMFIINEILVHLDFPLIITKFINKITKRKTNSYAIYVFIMSIFSGSPSNAIIIKNLVDNNEINEQDASYILSFTYFSNPLFLWTMLISIFNFITTIKIILIHYFTNIIIFFIFKNKLSTQKQNLKETHKTLNYTKIINNSIKQSLNTLLMILGTITFYIIISTVLINCFNFNLFLETLIKGLLEITQGLSNISLLNISAKIKEIIAISIISFGGLSIHSQIQNIISETKVQYKYFFIGRIIHVLISIFLVLF